MIKSTVTAGGSVRLPPKVRRALRAKPGTDLLFEISGKAVVVRSIAKVDELAGCFRAYARPPLDRRREREIVKEEVARAAAEEGT